MGKKHAEIISRSDSAEVVGVADPGTAQLAELCGVPHFEDHRALIEAGNADALIIASPNAFHVRTALDCLQAGLPALLEKPIATSYSEAHELIQATKTSETPILMGHHRRHHPAVKAARNLIARGELGRLVAVSGTWLTKKPDSYFEQTWRTLPGAGVMLINLVHDLDLLRHLCGEILSVQARSSNAARNFEVEDTASVIIEFENGALGSFIISDSVVAPWGWDQATEDDPAFPFIPSVSCYRIAGTEGSLDFPQLARYHHEGASDWSRPLSLTHEPRAAGDSYSAQLNHFIEVARGLADPYVNVEDAARSLAVIDATRKAASTDRAVSLAEITALAVERELKAD